MGKLQVQTGLIFQVINSVT